MRWGDGLKVIFLDIDGVLCTPLSFRLNRLLRLPAERQRFADSEHRQYSTESLAKCAYSMAWRAVRFSEEHSVPILLDFDRSENWLANGKHAAE